MARYIVVNLQSAQWYIIHSAQSVVFIPGHSQYASDISVITEHAERGQAAPSDLIEKISTTMHLQYSGLVCKSNTQGCDRLYYNHNSSLVEMRLLMMETGKTHLWVWQWRCLWKQ